MSDSSYETEREQLEKRALYITVYLVLVAGASFLGGVYALPAPCISLLGVALVGMSGSSVAALTSCLDRYANGFQMKDGTPFPSKVTDKNKERFNQRFSRWLMVRPFLGLIIAPVFLWGLAHFAKNPEEFRGSVENMGFTAFLAGLLAKSVVALIKDLFKSVFRA